MVKKIIFVFGTRPEAIKVAPIIRSLKSHDLNLIPITCVTAQHRGLLDDVLHTFEIKPNYDLNVMEKEQSLEELTGRVMNRLIPVLKKSSPDMVLVQGDTTTAFLAALAGFYLKIPVGHIEAGLRTYNYAQPFPEEANRRIIDAISSLHFAHTKQARQNLWKENISKTNIFVTGNSVIDALKWAVSKKRPFKNKQIANFLNTQPARHDSRLILVTAHRRESFGKPLENICAALEIIADAHPQVQIVFPVHPNPNVQKTVRQTLKSHPRILKAPPLCYTDFCRLMKLTYFIITDSGGLQEEGPFLGKPVLVLRDRTERPEAVNTGSVEVIGTNKENIVRKISKLITDPKLYRKMSQTSGVYGDGHAARRIIDGLLYYFKLTNRRPSEFKS